MNKKWLYLIFPVMFIFIVYLLFSWALWEMNPEKWDEEALTASCMMFVMGGGFGVLLAAIFNDNIPSN